jgi:chemotaxis protein CheX
MHTNPWAVRSPLLGGAERAKAMMMSLRDSVALISNPRNLDLSVDEVFSLTVGVQCRRAWEAAVPDTESVTAVVGFGGLLTGACVFRTGGTTACAISARMTGMEFPEIDDTVRDAIGEICNILAGTWKSKVPELAAHCDLSVPAVITGRDYKLHVQAPEFTIRHGFRFEDSFFEVTILCDGLQ